ncbi:MAG: polysaccharide biosynthesis/export family protein [Chthoniobacter sp.]|uniref:polysaccharide biosynthesis/export family protein n=1 Tax=Chthoniobacter sp. TaxID=2510640 RepID=UPI0032A23BBC
MELMTLQFPSCYRLSRRLICVLALGIGLLSCLPRAGAVEDADTYVLAPNDVLDIKVFQEDDLHSNPRVSTKGTITFPLIGVVTVAGRTPQEAATAIRAALAREYLVNPQVTVVVQEYGKRRVTVLGEVQKPGAYDMPDRDRVTLLDAIAMAGGYTRIADPAKIALKRKIDGKETVMKFNAKDMAKNVRTATFEVMPNDIVTVGESLF